MGYNTCLNCGRRYSRGSHYGGSNHNREVKKCSRCFKAFDDDIIEEAVKMLNSDYEIKEGLQNGI